MSEAGCGTSDWYGEQARIVGKLWVGPRKGLASQVGVREEGNGLVWGSLCGWTGGRCGVGSRSGEDWDDDGGSWLGVSGRGVFVVRGGVGSRLVSGAVDSRYGSGWRRGVGQEGLVSYGLTWLVG